MRLIVDACGRILRRIGIGGERLRVRARLVVLLDGLCARGHDESFLVGLQTEGKRLKKPWSNFQNRSMRSSLQP